MATYTTPKRISLYETVAAYKALLRDLFEVVRLTPQAEQLTPLVDLGLNDKEFAAWWWAKRQEATATRPVAIASDPEPFEDTFAALPEDEDNDL